MNPNQSTKVPDQPMTIFLVAANAEPEWVLRDELPQSIIHRFDTATLLFEALKQPGQRPDMFLFGPNPRRTDSHEAITRPTY